MPRIAAALMILALASSVLFLTSRDEPRVDQSFEIQAEPVVLDASDPARDRVGELLFRGGWVLSSANADFGGISGLALDGDGFVAVGDAGGVFRFALDAGGRISRAEISALPVGPRPENGGPPQKRDRDAEALVFDPQTDSFLVGFERANEVWRYDRDFTASDSHHGDDAMEDWPNNGGAEAMVRLADGRFLIFSEAGDGPADSREVLLFESDPSEAGPSPVRLGYRPPEGYNITDAAQLPDGRLLLLNRRFSLVDGVSVIVSVARIASLDAGTIIESRTVARLDPPVTVDNLEALVVTVEEGRTILWIASDDNFNPLQRTLLLQFELVPEG